MSQEDLDALLLRVKGGSNAQVTEWWKQFLRGPCPANNLARRYGLAWRLQAQQHGGLSDRTKRRLRELDAAFAADPERQPSGCSPIKPGTQFVRQWDGRSHTVHVTNHGYVYAGKEYGSLSAIARKITGTRWSGPRFFGIKRQK